MADKRFILTQFNGNTGGTEAFDTLEAAICEGDYLWSRKTDSERRTYAEGGNYFEVFEGDEDDTEWTAIRSWTEEARIEDWVGTVRVGKQGNSMVLMITDAARAMGLERGDYVDVTIRRKP